MSEQSNNPLVETHRDGAVSAKVWRNISQEGKPFYSVTFQRTYTDPATNKVAESRTFQGTDILKVPQLAGDAYRTIGKMRELDRADRAQTQAPQQNVEPQQQPEKQAVAQPEQGLAQQRDAVMENAAPTQNHAPEHGPALDR